MTYYASVVEYIQLSLSSVLELRDETEPPPDGGVETWISEAQWISESDSITIDGCVTVILSPSDVFFNSNDVIIEGYKTLITLPVSDAFFESPYIVIKQLSADLFLSVASVSMDSPDITILSIDDCIFLTVSDLTVSDASYTASDITVNGFKTIIPLGVSDLMWESPSLFVVLAYPPTIITGNAVFLPITNFFYDSQIVALRSGEELDVATRLVSNQFKYEKGAGAVDLSSDTFKIALMGTGFSFNQDTHGEWSDVSGYEILSSGGYTPGGEVLIIDSAWVQDNANDRGTIFWVDHTFVPSGGSFASVSAAVIYDSTHSSNLIVGAIEFDEDVSVPEGVDLMFQNLGFDNI